MSVLSADSKPRDGSLLARCVPVLPGQRVHGRGGGDAEEEAAGADPDVEVEPPQHPGDRVIREEQGFGLTAHFQSEKLTITVSASSTYSKLLMLVM